MTNHSYILGVDEVGRGPLAGPVVVAAVLLPRRFYLSRKLPPLRDSKKLTKNQRERWFQHAVSSGYILYEVSWVTPKIIDQINISEATNRAATRAVKRLVEHNNISTDIFNMYVDAFIKIDLDFSFRTLIKGDNRINAIKLASVIAKVTRDRKMVKLHKQIKEYGFDRHKGYGTLEHRRMLKKYGPSKIHRLTFLKH